jgi:general secretion pathway protein J
MVLLPYLFFGGTPMRRMSAVRPRSLARVLSGSAVKGASGRRGFTLIELLLAVTIFAMVVGVIFSAFRVGISAWQGGERDIVFNQSMRAVTELVFREINCTHPYKITPGTTDTVDTFSAFFGSSDSLLFVTRAALQNGIGGLSLIELWVDDENGLMLAEAPALFTSYDEMLDTNLRTDEYAEVLSEWVKKITVRYFKREDEEDEGMWQEQWDPRNSDGHDFPLMVEVVLLFEDVRGREIEHSLLVPIMSLPF